MKNPFIANAIDIAGGVSSVAEALEVSTRLVHFWIHDTSRVPYWAAAAIEILTKGQVTRQELCPQYYQPLQSLDYYVANRRSSRRAV